MKKWALAFAVAAVVAIGCGGGGGSKGSTSGSSSGSSGGSGPSVNLGSAPGSVVYEFLTGAGRAPGDSTAVIKHVQLISPNTGEIFESIVNPEIDLQLNGYTINTTRLNIPRIVDSVTFDQFRLEIESYFTGAGKLPLDGPFVSEDFPAHITVFPGRQSNIAVRLDDTMFSGGTFHDDIFLANNTSPSTGSTVNSYLADYVMFDITGMSGTHPVLPKDGTTRADKVYFTGDSYAVSVADAGNPSSPGEFDVITPIGFVEGTFQNPVNSGQNSFPGTFTLVQPDPRDPDPNTPLRITALQGIWRDYNALVKNAGTFLPLSFPSSQDNNIQTIVLVARSGNTITQMYFGTIDLTAGTLAAYPISQMSPASTANEIDGTVSSLKDASGSSTSDPKKVRSGSFTLHDGTGVVPAGFPSSGTFIVFRR